MQPNNNSNKLSSAKRAGSTTHNNRNPTTSIKLAGTSTTYSNNTRNNTTTTDETNYAHVTKRAIKKRNSTKDRRNHPGTRITAWFTTNQTCKTKSDITNEEATTYQHGNKAAKDTRDNDVATKRRPTSTTSLSQQNTNTNNRNNVTERTSSNTANNENNNTVNTTTTTAATSTTKTSHTNNIVNTKTTTATTTTKTGHITTTTTTKTNNNTTILTSATQTQTPTASIPLRPHYGTNHSTKALETTAEAPITTTTKAQLITTTTTANQLPTSRTSILPQSNTTGHNNSQPQRQRMAISTKEEQQQNDIRISRQESNNNRKRPNSEALRNEHPSRKRHRHQKLDTTPTTTGNRNNTPHLTWSTAVHPTERLALQRRPNTEDSHQSPQLGRTRNTGNTNNNNNRSCDLSSSPTSRRNKNNSPKRDNSRENQEIYAHQRHRQEPRCKDILWKTAEDTSSSTTLNNTTSTTVTEATRSSVRNNSNNRSKDVTKPHVKRHRPNNKTKNNSRTMRIGSINCGGRKGWFEGSILTLESHQLDLLFIIDTKLQQTPTTSITTKLLVADVFNTSTRSSSMIVLSPNASDWRVIHSESTKIGAFIRLTNGIERVQGVYMRPTNDWNKDKDRQTWLQDCLTWTKHNNAITIGDFNARHKNWDSTTKPRGTWLFKQCKNLDIHITTPAQPTFYNKAGSSNVDLCLQSNWTLKEIESADVNKQEIMPADHHLIIAHGYRTQKPTTEQTTRHLSHSAGQNKTKAAKYITSINKLTTNLDITTSNNYIIDQWNDILGQHFKKTKRKTPKFWTNECQEACNQYAATISNPTATETQKLEAAKKKRLIIKEAKMNIHNQCLKKITEARPGTMMEQLSTLTNWKQRQTTKINSNEFLDLLASKSGKIDHNPIEISITTTQYTQPPPNLATRLQQALTTAKKGKAPGIDGITNEALQVDPPSTTELLNHIVHNILRTTQLPDNWKVAEIIPVPKTADINSTNAADFRPIALLSTQRKIVERAVADELQQCWTLEDGQHGYQEGTGTEIATQIAHEQLQNTHHRMICLDLSGAFDKASRKTITAELLKLNTHPGWIDLATTFVTTPVKMQISNEGFWTRDGVAQGSSLSPILWNIFINTLQQELNTNATDNIPQPSIMYADDVAIFFDTRDTTTAQQLLDTCTKWAQKHDATWNIKKCCIICPPNESHNLFLTNLPLPTVSATNYLGLPFDCNGINYDTHIDNIINKATKKTHQLLGLGIVSSRGKPNNAELTIPAATTVYKALIRPILEHGTPQNKLTRIQHSKLNECQDTLLQAILGVQSRHPKAIRAAVRVTTFTTRLKELTTNLKLRCQFPKTLTGKHNLVNLTKLNSHLTQQALSNAEILFTQKQHIINLRQQEWIQDVGEWKFHPPWNNGLPPALHVQDARLSRWILKWYIGSATQNLSQHEQDTAFPNIRLTMKEFLHDTKQWTDSECKHNTRFIKTVRNQIMKALNTKKKQERNQLSQTLNS
jgi:hypothetical protein